MAFVPTILLMSGFPFIYAIENDDTVWIVSNMLLTFIGKSFNKSILNIGICLGFMMAVVLGISGILGP